MASPLISKLEHGGFLTEADRATLLSVSKRIRRVPKNEDLICEGDRPENVFVIMEGFACRYKLMPLARRHIMALLVPGDFCDLHIAILGHMDHSIRTLSACQVVHIPRPTIEMLAVGQPSLTRAFWWATLADEGVLREWLANMGQRAADRQLAHLFCELLVRLQAVGRATHDAYDFPLTQADLGDILGVSSIHVNRTLQELRADGFVVFKNRRVQIPDVERLNAFCSFNPNYLHFKPRVNGNPLVDAR